MQRASVHTLVPFRCLDDKAPDTFPPEQQPFWTRNAPEDRLERGLGNQSRLARVVEGLGLESGALRGLWAYASAFGRVWDFGGLEFAVGLLLARVRPGSMLPSSPPQVSEPQEAIAELEPYKS